MRPTAPNRFDYVPTEIREVDLTDRQAKAKNATNGRRSSSNSSSGWVNMVGDAHLVRCQLRHSVLPSQERLIFKR
jgi:hypothetical protein